MGRFRPWPRTVLLGKSDGQMDGVTGGGSTSTGAAVKNMALATRSPTGAAYTPCPRWGTCPSISRAVIQEMPNFSGAMAAPASMPGNPTHVGRHRRGAGWGILRYQVYIGLGEQLPGIVGGLIPGVDEHAPIGIV